MRSSQLEIFEALHSLPGDRGSFGITAVSANTIEVFRGFRTVRIRI